LVCAASWMAPSMPLCLCDPVILTPDRYKFDARK